MNTFCAYSVKSILNNEFKTKIQREIKAEILRIFNNYILKTPESRKTVQKEQVQVSIVAWERGMRRKGGAEVGRHKMGRARS